MKNGAELLDRLVKDIVSESAATYVSILQLPETPVDENLSAADLSVDPRQSLPMAFSLARFIPLLRERIYVLNPFTRTFLVSWVTLLDTIPDLELVFYLPAFLDGLFKFLSDPNRDVHIATQGALERFLTEIKKISKIKRGLAESRRSEDGQIKLKHVDSSGSISLASDPSMGEDEIPASGSESSDADSDDDWIPGQDVQVDYPKILDILVNFLDQGSGKDLSFSQAPVLIVLAEEEIQLTALRWIDNFFEISPEDILAIVPRLLMQVLPNMASGSDQVRQAANRVNSSLMDYIASFPDEQQLTEPLPSPIPRVNTGSTKEAETRSLHIPAQPRTPQEEEADSRKSMDQNLSIAAVSSRAPTPPEKPRSDLDYEAAVSTLMLHFLNEHEATRVAALSWLIMLHRKAPRKVLAKNDGTFPALLKTLSDPAEAVVTRDLQLLSQISRYSDDNYFRSFMENMLQLFCTDRRLLETRGNLIIRQLCTNLSAERIYKTLASCLEKDEDVEFASIMVQNLNNNLITAPELSGLRKQLRNINRDEAGRDFFVPLFRSWCHNAVSTFSLCLLAQAYEQAYALLQIFAELEMTVNMLIQIDKLVQLLESPVFTYLRLQLLEPEKYPYLYKCLYGLLMLLPQSSAFAALKNRLNSVSAIGYLHIPPKS